MEGHTFIAAGTKYDDPSGEWTRKQEVLNYGWAAILFFETGDGVGHIVQCCDTGERLSHSK
jgi:hypothetical protein